MKKTVTFSLGVLLVITLCFSLSGCVQSATEADVWSEAIYTEDAEFGEGAKTVMVEVIAEDKSVTFTIHSNEKILGDALVAHDLIEGEQGAYGLYVKKVNGITADYDLNQCYWGFNKNGESMMTGVDGAEFHDGEHYELVYTK